MESRWSESAARDIVQHYGKKGYAADLAYRIYGARLVGQDQRLVPRGGGSASVKTRVKGPAGDAIAVVCVTARGCDLSAVDPDGLSALRLEPLQALQSVDNISEADVAGLQRENLVDAAAPDPSAEALLHAFLPHRYIDHTLATALLALTDQPDGAALCRKVFAGRVGIVPYVAPGPALARAVAAVFQDNPRVDGLILLKNGAITFGDDARQSYERMIALVTMAERRLEKGRRKGFLQVELPRRMARPSEIAPALRGLLAGHAGSGDSFILTYRTSEAIRRFVNGLDLARHIGSGPVTPGHLMRGNAKPVILPAAESGRIAAFTSAARHAVADYIGDHRDYCARNLAHTAAPGATLDPLPRVFLVRGLGIFAAGPSAAGAGQAADDAEAAVEIIAGAESIGRFEGLQDAEVLDLQRQALGRAATGEGTALPLAGRVAVIAGAAGSIGRATARAFRDRGAEIALLDLDDTGMAPVARSVQGIAVRCDATREDSLHAALDQIIETFGGIDIVVSAVGSAASGRIGEMAEAPLRQSFEVNFFAHQRIAQAAVAVMLQQGTGGTLLFRVGAGAERATVGTGPSGLPGAATLALARQYAIDYGADRIRAKAVNVERVDVGPRAASDSLDRGAVIAVAVEDQASGNRLRREVKAADVARAFLDLALAHTRSAVAEPGGDASAVALN